MKVLVACEESQTTTIKMREKGIEAYSCDVLECSGGHPEWHIKGNCLPIINGNCSFFTQTGGVETVNGVWDLIIAHPPCTYLTISGNTYFSEKRWHSKAIGRYMDRVDAIQFFMQFVYCNAKCIAIENPIGIMSSVYRKPDQIIQPYEFGHPNKKSTCLWLKNLPKLEPTNIVEPIVNIAKDGTAYSSEYLVGFKDENGKTISFNDPRTAKLRSKTFDGIAQAFVDQWT